MKMSRRALRMQRHHKRMGAKAGLNMVSLMDIFTILVFFLLVHSSDVETLPSAKAVRLPESLAEKSPKQTVVVTVNGEDILVQGRKIASVSQVLDGAEVIESLKTELDYQARKSAPTPGPGGKPMRQITIMGDKEIPYRLLKKIMLTCVRANYENISLAVLKKETTG
jgi:biopolymer transport protein ExbD